MKVGLFFGSFNPVHVGHMVIANYMLTYTELDRVWFIVSPHNPLKQKNTLLDEKQRLQMVQLAIGDNSKMKASDIEFHLPKPSYTVTTLTYLLEQFPQHEFALIMGEDNLNSFHKWKNHDVILQHHDLYVYPRVTQNEDACHETLRNHPKIHPIKAPVVEISSTFIRESIKKQKNTQWAKHPRIN